MATITKTINSSGGDYASPAAAASAFVAGTVAGASAADDIVFNITENAAFTSTFAITANPTGYASYKLTVDSSVRHNGTYGSGARIVSSTVQDSVLSDTVAALNGTIEWLEVTVTGSGKLAAGWLITAGFNASYTKTMRYCMIHDNGNHSTSPFRTAGIGNTGTSGAGISCNFIAHNVLISKWKSGSTVESYGIGPPNASGANTYQILNVTVDDIDVMGGTSGTARGIPVRNFSTSTVKNTVVTKIGTNTTTGTRTCFSGNGGSTVGNNNASSDSTAFGTSSLTSIVRGDNFNLPDSGDYRPLSNSAPIYAAGADLVTTPTGVNLDLKGRDRDAQGDTWSIGAYQLSAGGGVTNTIALTAPTAYRIYQRSSGTATVTVSGTYTGTVTNVEVQVDSGSWATLQSGPTGGTYSGTVSVAEGTRTINVRFSNDTGTTATVSNVLVGDVFLIAGQSNAAGRLTNAQSYTHASQKAAVFDFNDTAWRQLTDPTNETASGGTPWPLLATQFLADQSVPVGFINAAEGGTSMGQWWTTSAQAKWTSAKGRVTSSGVNAIKAVLWDQGETDAINDEIEATYNSRLDGLAGDVATVYGCSLIVAQVGTTTGIDAGSDLDAIRSAQVTAWGDNTAVKPGPLGYDRADLHWTTDAEGLTIAKRWWLALDAVLYGGGDGRGPRVSSASLNAARTIITVTFDRALKTGLTFSTAPWTVLDNGAAATVSSVAYHGSNTSAVTLTLSSGLTGGSGTCTVSYASGNTATGLPGIPKSEDITPPTGTAIQIPAEPFYSRTVSEAPPTGSFAPLGGGLIRMVGI